MTYVFLFAYIFFHYHSFSPWWLLAFLIFFTADIKFHVFLPTKLVSFVFFILSLPLALSLLSTSQRLHLTNKEVLTVLCSVVKHAGSVSSK